MRPTSSNFGPFLVGSIAKALSHYSQYRPASLTMQQYLDFGRTGTARSSFLFLRTELLVRMANIMREFDLLPAELLQIPSAKLVGDWYRKSFDELLQFERVEPSANGIKNFNSQLRSILRRHNTVVETMAEAIIELKEAIGSNMAGERNIQYFLDRFYLNRISIRMLQNQHLAIFDTEIRPNNQREPNKQHVGFIDPSCDVEEILMDAFENARFLAEHHYCIVPSLKIKCVNSKYPGEKIRVALVPLHLYYIVFEVLKNSMRATIEQHHKQTNENELPPISIDVVLGQENMSIKISDLGGGVPIDRVEHLFHYMYSTAPKPERDMQNTPFAGYGYGLPISRLYSRYFLGDLTLTSMEGLGTDTIIHLKAIPSEASELLPVFGTSSRRFITMTAKVPDWITKSGSRSKESASSEQHRN